MLCEPKHLKRDFVSDWLGRQWSSLFMGDAPAQAALARHMDYAMLHGIRPVEPDQALLNRARQALLKIPLAELAYQQMKEEAQEGGKPPFTFRSSLGKACRHLMAIPTVFPIFIPGRDTRNTAWNAARPLSGA